MIDINGIGIDSDDDVMVMAVWTIAMMVMVMAEWMMAMTVTMMAMTVTVAMVAVAVPLFHRHPVASQMGRDCTHNFAACKNLPKL